MSRKGSAAPGHRIEISGDLDRQAVEALHLELRRLARRYGIEIAEVRIRREANESVSREDGETSA